MTSGTGPGGTTTPSTQPVVLDLTGEPAVESAKAKISTETIAQKREDTRKLMAMALLVALATVSIAWLAVGVWGDKGDVRNAGDALDKIFTGILGLTGTAVGFYFGVGTSEQSR